ncbi:type IV secretory system conjugative DNA transfer family protein [Arenibacter certesii]|nr:type IV secretory system conjugative DNA transfer family protein [Arenibacter certesii]
MNDKNLAFSAMLLSATLFATIGFMTYYPIVQYLEWDSQLSVIIHDFLNRFKALREPLPSRVILVMVILGAVMLYNPRKKENRSLIVGLSYFLIGCLLLFITGYFKVYHLNLLWCSLTLYSIGFLLSISGSVHLFQVIDFSNEAENDPFNDQNETFRQMEDRIDTKYSVNIPYEYHYKGQLRQGWINFVNLFRALLVIGTPGSGKSFALIEEIIEQMIEKNFTLLIYDFKFDTLSKVAYNYWRRKKERTIDANELSTLPVFYTLSFDNIEKSHRCNPIDPYLMRNQTDAADAATIIMKNLNKEWIKRSDFFSKSAISFVSGLIWYLKKKSEETGENICTLPHVITLSTINIEYLLEIMMTEVEVRSLMIPFKDAMERQAGQQLAGQTASAQISLSLLASKEIYYIMTGNDFRLDINNPQKPKIVCIQNNPDRSEIYAAPIGLYINKILQVVNKPGCRPLGLILDELPTVFIMGLRKIIDTGRSHYVASVLGIQSITQLIADYGRELAEVIFDNCSNVFTGAAKGETARRISEIFGRIHQEKKSKAISNNDTTVNFSTILSELLPKSKITSMSTGHFGGIVADTFENPIEQKLCFGLLKPNMESKKIQGKYEIPIHTKFKSKNHQELVESKLKLIHSLNFFEIVQNLDFSKTNYLDFYTNYTQKFATEQYGNHIQRMQFIPLALELKLFDHLQKLEEITKDDSDAIQKLEGYITALVDRMYIEKEIDKVLDANFMKVIHDINLLVEREYIRCTGNKPKLAVFDKQKITDEIAASLEKNEDIAKDFIKEYRSMPSKELADAFRRQHEIPIFEKVSAINQTDVVNGYLGILETLYSSYPIEMYKE